MSIGIWAQKLTKTKVGVHELESMQQSLAQLILCCFGILAFTLAEHFFVNLKWWCPIIIFLLRKYISEVS